MGASGSGVSGGGVCGGECSGFFGGERDNSRQIREDSVNEK